MRWCKKKGLTSCPPCRLEGRGKTNSEEVEVGNGVTADKAIRQALTLGSTGSAIAACTSTTEC